MSAETTHKCTQFAGQRQAETGFDVVVFAWIVSATSRRHHMLIACSSSNNSKRSRKLQRIMSTSHTRFLCARTPQSYYIITEAENIFFYPPISYISAINTIYLLVYVYYQIALLCGISQSLRVHFASTRSSQHVPFLPSVDFRCRRHRDCGKKKNSTKMEKKKM